MAVREFVRGRKKQRAQPIVASQIPNNGKQMQATRPGDKGQVARNKKIAVIASAQAKERAKCRRPSLGPGMPRAAACGFVARMPSNVFKTRLDRFHGNGGRANEQSSFGNKCGVDRSWRLACNSQRTSTGRVSRDANSS